MDIEGLLHGYLAAVPETYHVTGFVDGINRYVNIYTHDNVQPTLGKIEIQM
jgi:hypothetical protein